MSAPTLFALHFHHLDVFRPLVDVSELLLQPNVVWFEFEKVTSLKKWARLLEQSDEAIRECEEVVKKVREMVGMVMVAREKVEIGKVDMGMVGD